MELLLTTHTLEYPRN